MDIKKFSEEICRRLEMEAEEGRAADGAGYEVVHVSKSGLNGVEKEGICIKREWENITPCVYLEPFHEEYEKGMATLEECATNVMKTADEAGHNPIKDEWEIGRIMEKKWVLEHLSARLVNTERNLHILSECPHTELLNLSVIYYIHLGSDGESHAAIRITNKIMKGMGCRLEDFQEAMEPRLEEDHCFCSMCSILRSMLPEVEEEIRDKGDIGMYVLTNRPKMFGAVSIASEAVRRRLADGLGCRAYVLPSSVHEMIVIPEDKGISIEALSSMVRDVNRHEVNEEEQLSDDVYILDEDGGLSMAEAVE